MSEAVTSAGTSQGCDADEVHACGCSGCAARLLSKSVAGQRAVGALMRHKKKALQPNPHSQWSEERTCLDRNQACMDFRA